MPKKTRKRRAVVTEAPFLIGVALTVVVLAAFAYALFCLPVVTPGESYFNKWSYLREATPNEVGDTLAGVAGSLAFVWLVVTVWIQASELREQRAEFEEMNETMAGQRFETTYFEMLSAFGEIVGSIDLVNQSTNVVTSGRDCFSVFYTRLNKLYRAKLRKGHSEEDSLEMAYTEFWNKHQLELGHYFRFLYNYFRLLSENPQAKEYHAKLLRSQLSDQELLVLYYNCLSSQGSKFLRFAAQFELFDNLPTVRLLNPSHANLVDRCCFGSNPMLKPGDMKHSINKPKD